MKRFEYLDKNDIQNGYEKAKEASRYSYSMSDYLNSLGKNGWEITAQEEQMGARGSIAVYFGKREISQEINREHERNY